MKANVVRWNVSNNATEGLPRQIAPDTWWFGWCLVVPEGDRYVHNGNNAFLVIGSKATILIDTAMPMGWPELQRDLARVLNGRKLDYILPTHPEAPHMGNLDALMVEYPQAHIVGDLRNYHLFFPHLQKSFFPMQAGDAIDLGDRQVVLKKAIIHDLPNTLWAYVPDIELLFASDGYPYTHEHEHGQCAMTSQELPAPIRPEDTSTVISRALNWVRYVDASKIMAELREFLRAHPVKIVAPCHGGIITNIDELTDIMEEGLARGEERRMSRITRLHQTTLALSDIVQIDDRISWHAPGQTGFEPYNEYLIDGGDRALLIDGGVALHAESIIATLREQLNGRKLYLFPTRVELECIGNFGRLIAAFPDCELVTGNGLPLAALFHMPDFSSTKAPISHLGIGDTLAKFGFPHIKIYQGPLRILGTSWLWDERSRILYTTDSFNTDMLDTGNESIVRTSPDGMPQPSRIFQALIQKFDWLPVADTSSIEREWNEVFATVDPLMIAPIHGRVQSGPQVVRLAIDNHHIGSFRNNRIGSFDEQGGHLARATT